MRALLTDLDRTLTDARLALDPRVPPALRALRARGVRVAIVTGRPLAHVLALDLPHDAIVAENGAVVAWPGGFVEVEAADFAARSRRALGARADRFLWGAVVASGPRGEAAAASEALRRHGVAHSLSYNVDEVMLLPLGVDKASGARRVLSKLGIPPREAFAIGDGENDVPMLRMAGAAAAPANAHAEARAAAGSRLRGAYADGLLELLGDARVLARQGGPV